MQTFKQYLEEKLQKYRRRYEADLKRLHRANNAIQRSGGFDPGPGARDFTVPSEIDRQIDRSEARFRAQRDSAERDRRVAGQIIDLARTHASTRPGLVHPKMLSTLHTAHGVMQAGGKPDLAINRSPEEGHQHGVDAPGRARNKPLEPARIRLTIDPKTYKVSAIPPFPKPYIP